MFFKPFIARTLRSFKFSRKKAVLAGALLFVLILALQIPNMAKSRLQSMLVNTGFKHVTVDRVSIGLQGFSSRDIKLDEYNMDEIKNFDVRLNWLSYLLTDNISEIRVSGVRISREADSLSSSARQLMENLLHLPNYKIHLSDVTIDLNSFLGVIRMNLEAAINQESKKNPKTRDIKARVIAAQYQLGFDSTWEGTLDEDGHLDIAGTIVDGRLRVGPLRISRFNGWTALGTDQKGFTLQNQMEAGSATFMNVPLQNITLVDDMNMDHHNMIVRAGLSGTPDVLFSMDIMRDEKQQGMTAILKGRNFGNFLNHVKKSVNSSKSIHTSLLDINDFKFSCNFDPEKRFVGGPLPFSIKFMDNDEKIMDGNVLFYPDTFDVRGSLETDTDTALGLQEFFKIPSENMKQNFIRLDGSAKRFFKSEEKESVQ